MITRREIASVHQAIAPHLRVTPVIDLRFKGTALPVCLKLENLQHTGSFKARGAFASLVNRKIPAAGVAAASGGNHGAAVAYAAHELGIAATIFVPAASPEAKVARIRAYGARVVQEGATYQEAARACARHIALTGALGIHAYDDETTLLGQGTLAREFEEQAPDLDTVIVAVGGGGLIGGVASWYAGCIRIIAAEPVGCPTLHAALAAGEPVDIAPGGLAADSLGASRVGKLMFPIAQSHVEQVTLVNEDAIRTAQAWLWDNLRLITEPGGAVAFAALHSGAYRPAASERVGVIICGANTDPVTFARDVLA